MSQSTIFHHYRQRQRLSIILQLISHIMSWWCSLGLQRIVTEDNKTRKESSSSKQQQQNVNGHVITLRKTMFLGRTPPPMLKALEEYKAKECSDNTWTEEDQKLFQLKHKQLGMKYAMLRINCTTDEERQRQKTHSNSNGISFVSNNEHLPLNAVSRKLLQVVDFNNSISKPENRSITLKRCVEPKPMEDTAYRYIKPIDVFVYRNLRKRGKERSTRTTRQQNKNANRNTNIEASTVVLDVIKPEENLVLKEGDMLMILDSRFQYKVVRSIRHLRRGPNRKCKGTIPVSYN